MSEGKGMPDCSLFVIHRKDDGSLRYTATTLEDAERWLIGGDDRYSTTEYVPLSTLGSERSARAAENARWSKHWQDAGYRKRAVEQKLDEERMGHARAKARVEAAEKERDAIAKKLEHAELLISALRAELEPLRAVVSLQVALQDEAAGKEDDQ